MGLPASDFIAATNRNNVVPLFLKSGKYQPKPSVATISNAMDVGNPSNFSRILDFYDGEWLKIVEDISGYFFTDDETRSAILEIKELYNYIMDPHGAVGYLAAKQYY